MPLYKHRPDVLPGEPVRRYYTFEGAIATLKSGALRLTRIDTFDDPFEGSVPTPQHNNQVIFAGSEQARWSTNQWFATRNPEMAQIIRPPNEDVFTRLACEATPSPHPFRSCELLVPRSRVRNPVASVLPKRM
jgi:hypothetical protein